MGRPRIVNFIRRNTIMEDIKTWIVDHWADIVAFFDKLFAIVNEIIEG